ncbi:MAG: hypothetical protein ACFFBD_01640 [Candidatus Hodarchaeota archaeon]
MLLIIRDQNIPNSEKQKIMYRQWLKYSYVIGRIVQKYIWEQEGVWHPSLINRLQDECPEINPTTKTVHVFINNLKIDISQPVKQIISQCSRAQRYIETIGADYSDFYLEKAYYLAVERIASPLLKEIYG